LKPSKILYGTDRILIKPRQSEHMRAQDRLAPEDIAVIDLEGQHLAGPFPPPSERSSAPPSTARPDVQAVVHTQQPMATVMSIGGVPILPVLHVEGEVAEQPVPPWPHAMLVTTPELGAN